MKNCFPLLLALTCLNVSAVGAETVGAGGSAGGATDPVGKPTTVKIDGVDDELEVTGHWGRCPTVLPIGRPKEHPPAHKTNRYFFPDKDMHACGPGVDTSGWWIHEEEKRFKPALNRSYDLYNASDEKRENRVGTLIVKNGNGFIDGFDFGTLTNVERRFGKSHPNLFSGIHGDPDYSETHVFVFEVDAIDQETGSFSKFQLGVYAYNDSVVTEYVLRGPGIVGSAPIRPEMQTVIQYVPDTGTYWVDLRDGQSTTFSIRRPGDVHEMFALVARKLQAQQDLTPIPRPFDGSSIFGHTTGRSERHQRTSPTLPEGAPIPDSR